MGFGQAVIESRRKRGWMAILTGVVGVLVLLSGCSSAPLGIPAATPSPPAAGALTSTAVFSPTPPAKTFTPTPGLIPKETGIMVSPEANPPAYDPAVEPLVQRARADLARRLGLQADQVEVIQAERVFWPDASLGCPEPGMVYAQVITPGYLILLRAGGEEYEYHTSTGTQVVTCENPAPPVPGMPEDV